jgi:molybdopterin-dependent oxidoreductase alpha subunit
MLEGIERTFGFKPPHEHGHDSVAAMEAMLDGRSKVFIGLGGNLAVALSDPENCFKAMRNVDMSVHIATKLNRSHLLIGKDSIILPCLGRTEMDIQSSGPQSVTVEDSMSMVHASRGKLPPASGFLLSEPAIVAGIAKATLPNTRVAWDELVADYDRIRDCIESVFPDFNDYNERIRQPGGFRLPLPATERIWKTPSGKAEFLLPAEPASTAGALLLTTIRSHDQYNTTIYGNDDRYRGVFGRRDVVFMCEEDLVGRNLRHGDRVDISTAVPGFENLQLKGFTAVSYDIAPGSVAAYFPEANCLVPLAYQDKQSGTPAYKSIPVKITRQSTTEQR